MIDKTQSYPFQVFQNMAFELALDLYYYSSHRSNSTKLIKKVTYKAVMFSHLSH